MTNHPSPIRPPDGSPGIGEFQPPRKSSVARHETVTMLRYSAMKEQPEPQPRVLGVESADELGLRFDQVERRAVGLADRR